MAAAGAIRAGRAYVEIFANTASLKKSLKGARAQLSRFAMSVKTLGSSITTPFKTLQSNLASVGAGLLTIGTAFTVLGAAASYGLAKATSGFAEFDKQMRFVQGIVQETGQGMEELRERALALGRTTSFTATEVAEGMTELARAGRNTAQIYGEVEDALNASRGTMTDLAETTRILVSTMSQFGLATSESSRTADTLVSASNKASHSFEELGQAMKFVGPMAHILGFTLEEVSAALNMLAKKNIKATLAGRQLARVFKEMVQPSKKLAMEELGMKFEDAGGGFTNMVNLFKQLDEATKFMSSSERIGFFQQMFGIGASAALVIAENVKGLDDMTNSIIENRGASKALMELVEGGLWGSIKKLTSAVDGAAKALVKKLGPAFSYAIDGATLFVKGLADSIKNSENLAKKLIQSALLYAAMTAGILATGIAMKTLASAMIVVGGATTLVMLPLIASVKILSAVIGVLVQTGLTSLTLALTAFSTTVTVTANVVRAFSLVLPMLASVATGVASTVSVAMSAIAASISTVLLGLPAAGVVGVLTLIGVEIGVLATLASRAGASLTNTFTEVAQGLSVVKDNVKAVVNGIRGSFVTLGSDIASAFKFVDLTRGLQNFAKDFDEVLYGMGTAISSGNLGGILEVAVASMKLTWVRFTQYLKTTGVQGAISQMSEAFQAFGRKAVLIFEFVSGHLFNMKKMMDAVGGSVSKVFKFLIAMSPLLTAMAVSMKKGFKDMDLGLIESMDAETLMAGLDKIDREKEARNRKNHAIQESLWKKGLSDEKKARLDLIKSVSAAQQFAIDKRDKHRRDVTKAKMEAEKKAAELQVERTKAIADTIRGLRGKMPVAGKGIGTFSAKLADQMLRASGQSDLLRETEKQTDILSSMESKMGQGLAVGIQ